MSARERLNAKWEIRERVVGGARVDLYQGRTQRLEDVSMVEAMRHLKDHLGDEHKVHRVEPDGYRTDITRQVRRKVA